MSISKEWKWEVLSKDDEYWSVPDFMIHYLNYRWSNLGFKDFLDVGCGLGRHSIFMAENNYNVYAFDSSKYVVDVVREKAYEKKLNVKALVGDLLNFPFENESVDCMVAINVLSNNDKDGLKKILKEMHRVLKPGGETYFNIISKISDVDYNDELFNGNTFYNITEADFGRLFKDFTIVGIKNIEDIKRADSEDPSYCVLLKKGNKRNKYDNNKSSDNAFVM